MEGVKHMLLHDGAKALIVEFTFAPGAESKGPIVVSTFSPDAKLRAPHSSPLAASAYVARGVAIFQMGEAEEERLAAGRFVEIPPGAIHSVRADANGEMVLVLTIWK